MKTLIISTAFVAFGIFCWILASMAIRVNLTFTYWITYLIGWLFIGVVILGSLSDIKTEEQL